MVGALSVVGARSLILVETPGVEDYLHDAKSKGGFKQYLSAPHRFLQDSTDSWGFLGIPEDSSGLHYNFSDFGKILSSPQESSGLGQSLAEFLLN